MATKADAIGVNEGGVSQPAARVAAGAVERAASVPSCRLCDALRGMRKDARATDTIPTFISWMAKCGQANSQTSNCWKCRIDLQPRGNRARGAGEEITRF